MYIAQLHWHVLRLLTVVVPAVCLACRGGETDIDLDRLLVTRADLPNDEMLWDAGASEAGFGCLPNPEAGRGVNIGRSNGRPFFSQTLLLYDSEDIARRFFDDLQQRWADCTEVTWKLPPQRLDTPSLGDESQSFFISADCCQIVDPRALENGHLHTAFVRRGRLIEMLSVITRDTGEFEHVVTTVDAEIATRLQDGGSK